MGVMERYQKSKKEKETSVGVMARYEMNKKYESLDVSNVDDAYISSFVSDANTFFGKFGEGKEPSYTEANSALGDLDTRYQTVAGWLYKNKSNLDQKAYDDFSASLTDLKKGLDGAKEYYGQFDSEDSYRYAKKVAGIQNMSAAELEKKLGGDAIAYTTPDGANITWQSLYEKKKKEEDAEALYQTLAVQPDFKEYTGKGASIVNPSVKDAEGAAYLFGWRPFSKKVGNVVTYSRDNEQDIMTNELNSGYDRVGDFRYAYMTDKEVDVYNYYLAKYGEGKASDYLDSIYDDLNRRYEEKAIEKTVAFAEKFPFYASAASVAANLYSGVELLFESAFAKELDSNFLAESASAIRGTVSKKVDWEIGQFDAFDFLYNTGMSAADSVASMLTFGKGGGYVLGLSAAAQGVNDAKKRGLSDKRAFANGFISGVFEGLFETVSIGNFSVLKETASHSLKGIAKNIAKSMLVNASEETFTELANIAYDTIMNGDFSAYQTAVRSYTDSGLSESEAKRKAALDLGGQVLEAGASGALMGVGFGAVGSAMGTLKNNAETKELYGDSADALIKEGLASPIGTESRVLAEAYQKKLSEGKTLSGGELARLVRANEAQIASEETAQNVETTEKPLGVEEYAKILKAAEDPRPSADVAAVREENVSNDISETVAESETPSPSLRDTSPVGRGLEDVKADDGGSVTLLERDAIPYRNAESDRSADENHTHDALAGASEKYGAQAGAMIATYKKGQDVDAYDRAYGMAYEMGKSGVSLSYVMNSKSTAYLTESQRKIAYETGAAASDREAAARDGENKKAANGKTGWRRGTVKGEGVTISDLKKTFNDTQNTAYKLLSTYAEATGIDIVLFKSEVNEDGQFEGAQGKFKWSENTIYVDINAGLADAKNVDDLAKYTMMRTFSHEFTHFLEKWNPVRYNEFRKAVFDTLTERGEDVHDLIQTKQAQDASGTMTYDEASREVIAEAMTDILPDANFVQDLAENHKSVFAKLLEKLKEFLDDLKAYFSTIGANRSREANALKEQVGHAVRYVENIVILFDKVAVEAVDAYQMAVAVDAEINEITSSQAETGSTVTDIADENADFQAETSKTDQHEHFSITDNAEFGSLEIKFDGKPSKEILDMLKKEFGFHWHKKKSVWYGKADRAEIANSLQAVYKAYDIGVKEAQTQKSIVPAMKSTAMNELEKEVRHHLLPIIDAYNRGVADEINRQTISEVNSENESTDIKPEAVTETPEAIPQEESVTEEAISSDMIEKTTNKEEVNQNVENADNEAAVSRTHADRQGDSRVLDEVETGDVSRDAPRGDTLDDAVQRERETARDDHSDDAGRSERGHGEGSGESADLRRDDGLTPEEASQKAEELHEEVGEQIEQQSTETPKGKNFVIGDSLSLPNGEKARFKVNVAAIRLVKKLEAEGRYATESEQQLLSKYVGWGGLANAFDERKADWSREYKELKELLTDEEYAAARGSTLNAHYTDISVIKAMYDGLAKLGFNGGRMLEPSSGVGNFVGAMPAEMSAKVKSWTMVELDNITGLIAKYLYPNADVRIQGFEKANIPNNFMDVAISNVPFGDFPITDKAYPKKVTSSIHNYFFAKTLDKVRPGGIVMFITSSYTMNSKDSTVRRYIMQRADLLGAVRLPDSAFKGNAGTEVVTDILILKKRAENTPYTGENFLEAPWSYPVKGNYNGAHINDYFTEHPEMVLGTPSMDGGMYRGGSLTYKALEGKGSLADQIREAFSHIKGKMDYPARLSPEKTNFAVERAAGKTKQNGFVSKEGKIFQNQDGSLVPVEVNAKVAERISGMLGIRDAAKNLLNYQQQGLKESEIKKARQTLNRLYDDYVKKYGFLNASANKSAFKEDPDCYSLFALENWDSEKKKATKADIFTKNTVAPNRTVTSAKDVTEGLIVSVNQTGGVDVALIARLTGKTDDEVRRELIDSRLAYKNRDGLLETAETYLSGNVRAKIRDAEAMVPMDADYQKNVEALKAIVPKDVSYQEIAVQPGTPWIPNSVYSDFAAYMLGGRNTEWRQDVDVTRNPETGNFTVELKSGNLKYGANNTQRWGTPRRSFLDLFDAMLNSKSVVVKIKLDDGTSVVDKDATAAANEKIENITKEFSEWLWKDEARRAELATLYNEVFNSIVTPKYNGENLTVNGLVSWATLRPHQKDAVQRVISSGGNTLLAHKVGAGKTLEMAASAMKLRELGLIKKPMFAVPKSLVAQWGKEFHDFFPTAKLLVAEATDFTAANRKTFMNRIANGDYDAVIVSYEQFERLPMSADFTRELYREQVDSVIAAIEEAKAEKGAKALSVKDLEKKRKSLQVKIDKLTDSAKDEGNIDFEELGVDSLFIDEAHNFKNLFYTTSMTNVAGLGNKDGSKRAFDLYTKVRYLQKLNGGRGIVFATATPVMNSMSEMYIMQKYLQPDVLNQLGLTTFDAWAKQFGEVVNGVEIKPSGQGYRIKQSFSRFKNMSELQLLFRNFADVLTDVPGLKIPKMKGGKVNVVVCEPGQFQKDYMKELEKRADNVKNVDPSVDNMLKITSDGRKISYTQRMIDPTLPYEEGCKIYRCADNVVKEYEASADVKGTQIIFCDMATPKGKSHTETSDADADSDMDMESARLYDDIKARLIDGGIPEKEIAFIHEADTDAKKTKLFADVNDGKVRVLIGSTGKMGVGMNAQKRIVAIHHLDAPWRPGDVEQRDGRAFRQKNMNDEVSKYTYVTEGSFDARLWDILERKQNFIGQIMNGENVGRETEDTGEVTLSAAEVKALASGSPLIMEQVQLDTDIKKLESLQRAHRSAMRSATERLEKDKGIIDILKRKIASGKADMASTVDTYSEGKFAIHIGGQKFTDKKDAGVALVAEATAKANIQGYTSIGTFAGFEMRVIKTDEGIKGVLQGKESYPFSIYPGNPTYGIGKLVATVEGISESVTQWEAQMKATEADLAEQKKLIAEPFAKQAELDRKRLRYKEVMDILNPKEEQSAAVLDDEKEQAQSREYLEEEQHQQRTATLSDREVLELAAKDIRVDELTEAEQNALGIFEERLDKLKKLQEDRAEQGKLYKEQQFGAKVDRKAASETLERMKVLDSQIQRATADVLSVEEKRVLKRVLEKARKVVEAEERKHGKELLDRWRERRDNAAAIKKYRDRLRFDVDELSAWILKPDHKNAWKHVPDALKNTVIPFLSSINFMSKRSLNGGDATASDKKFIQNTKALAEAIKTNIDIYGLYSGYNDLPADFMERLQTFIESVQNLIGKSGEEFVINKMTSEELKDLSQIVRTLKKYIIQINRFHSNAMYQHVYEAGDDSIHFLAGLDNAGSHAGKISNFVLWQQMRPAYAFERFGNGGKAIYDELRRGQAKLAFNTKEIQSFAEKAYTEKEVKTWENEIKEFSLGGDLVKIPVSGIMSLYELSKDPEALEHISGGGIRVATYTYKGKKISDVGHIITPEDLNAILSSLTQRQIEVADALQKYMATQGAKWGNHVSVARFGEELFTKEHYFPINSDGRHLQATADEKPEGAALYALLNMSFTKSRKKGANNRIVVYSIFDVFANHMASMAQYNAMALPILDALKWFNYQQTDIGEDEKKEILGSVREQMARVYGVPEETKPGSGNKGYAESFVVNILKAFNGTEAQGTPYDTSALKSLRRYNMAQVAYSLRVVVQQPLAITRAAMLIDYTSIMKGLKLKPSEIRSNIEEMQKYSGIAAWKSLGFYDVNISRGLTTLIKQDETWMDKVGNIGMWGAEKMDLWAWASMWSACKTEVTKKERLTPENEGFYEAVTKLFEDVIYKTQVVDSILTKNEFMRDKGFAARAIGSFMSEPVTTASMVVDAFDKFHHDIKRGMTRRQAWKHNSRHIGRTLYVYGVSAVILAAVQAAADAFRDDDEYENYGEKWVEAFIGNVIDELAPFNKLPIVSDLYEIMKTALEKLGVDTYGNPPQSVIMQWWDSLVKGVEIISDKINGEDTNYTWYGGVSKLLQAVSGMMGLPMASATREIVAAWNNTIGAMAPSLKVKIYDAGARSEIRYAYIDGYLTEKEATKALIEKGIAEDENDAYFILKEFDAEGEYSRYGSLLSAVKTLSPIRAEMKELVSHGYTEKEIVSKIKSEIGKWYRSGEITRAEAERMLMKYADIDRETMKKTVDKWSCVIVTGIAYEDIDDKYLAGEITKQRAIQMYMRYGNLTKEEAVEKVDRLKE